MYFDNKQMAEVVSDYRQALVAARQAQAHLEQIQATVQVRRLLRVLGGGAARDPLLCDAQKRAEKLQASADRLRDRLCEAIYLVASGFANRFRPRGDSMEVSDCIQVAVWYTIQRIDRFDPSRGTSLLSWITACVKYAWLPLARKRRVQKRHRAEYARHRRHQMSRAVRDAQRAAR